MKKIIICFLSFSMIMLGCKKALDITPDGRLALEDVFKDEKQTEAYLNTVYNSIPSYFWKYQFFSYLAGVTDEAQDSDVGIESSNIAANWAPGSLSPSFNPLEIAGQGIGIVRYNTYWTGIRNANVFLANVPTANITNETRRRRFIAEARVLRAFFYFELVKQFGSMPVIQKPFSNTFDYESLTRPTFQANIDSIVTDCDFAIANTALPMRITEESERGRFTKAVAYAIKSQALLYNASPLWNAANDNAKWQAASVAAKEGLTALTSGGQFSLFPNYNNYFLNQSDISPSPNDKETIFERPEGPDGTFTSINSIPSKPGIFKAGTCPSQELVDSYDMQATGLPAITGYSDADHLSPIINAASGYNSNDPYAGRDPRFYATVWYNGALYDNINGAIHTMETFTGGADQLTFTRNNTHTGYYLRKFIDPKLASGVGHNSRWKKYRLAELYLNYAEAENEVSGATADVYAAVNTVRARANMPNLTIGLSKDEMRKRIRNERRVEFSIEEHRFWDTRRWKTLSETDKIVTGMRITKTGGTFKYQRIVVEKRNAWQDKFRIFPIPLIDVSNIPDFSKNQNPGW